MITVLVIKAIGLHGAFESSENHRDGSLLYSTHDKTAAAKDSFKKGILKTTFAFRYFSSTARRTEAEAVILVFAGYSFNFLVR